MLDSIWKWWVLSMVFMICINAHSHTDQIVDTSLGKVAGARRNNVIEYLGIPYAEPPIGALRFRPSIPKRPWYPSVWQAKHFSPECLQSTTLVSDDGTVRDEDCLYLNIWRPVAYDHSKPLPVLVWIYGGAFIHGGSAKREYNGQYLAERGVVVVSMNYRVGALGFLVSIRDGLYGNYGLEDQRIALEWIRTNIRMFGGDPHKITLFGESAGAMSIGLHFLDNALHKAPYIRSAFDRIIMESNPLGYKYRSIAVANFLGEGFKEQLDCEDLVCLQSESAEEILHVQDSMMAVPRSLGDFFTWGPVETDQAYYQEVKWRPGPLCNITVSQPLETLQTLKYHNLPVLLGSNAHEGNMFVYGAYSGIMTKVVFQAVLYGFFREMTSKVLQTYAGLTAQIAKSPSGDYRAVLSQIIGDYLFRCPTQQFADQLHELGYSVYLYEFALPTKVPNFPFCDGLSCHTCEIPFVFANTKLIEDFFSWDNSMCSVIFESSGVTSNEYTRTLDSKISGTSWLEKIVQSFFGSQSIYPAREAIRKGPSVNEHVVDLMSSFWISFADSGTPSHGSELWPPLKTTQLSAMGKFISNRVQLNNQGIVNNKIPIQGKKQLMHQMQFGTKSKVVLIENDCICDFWRSVNYRF